MGLLAAFTDAPLQHESDFSDVNDWTAAEDHEIAMCHFTWRLALSLAGADGVSIMFRWPHDRHGPRSAQPDRSLPMAARQWDVAGCAAATPDGPHCALTQ